METMSKKRLHSTGKMPLPEPSLKVQRTNNQIKPINEAKNEELTLLMTDFEMPSSGKNMVPFQEIGDYTASMLQKNVEMEMKEPRSGDDKSECVFSELLPVAISNQMVADPTNNKHFLLMELLPELKAHVVGFLPKRDLLMLRYTCHELQRVVDNFAPFVYVPMAGMLAILEKQSISKYQKLKSIDLIRSATRYFQSRTFPGKMGFQLNELGDFDAEGVECLPKELYLLRINKCRLESTVLSQLPWSLSALVLNSCNVKNEDLLHLPPHLKRLSLGECKEITDVAVSFLPRGIQKLTLAGCEKITNIGIHSLPNQLLVLEMTGCKGITDEAIAFLPRSIKRLTLTGCTSISSKAFSKLPPRLEYVDLIHTSSRLNEDFKYLPLSVQDVRFCSCNGVTTYTAKYIPSTLKRISLIHCSDLAVDLIKLLPQNLDFLSLYGCATDAILENLQPSLTELDLCECKLITDNCVKYFPENLKRLFLRHTQITDEGIRQLPCQKLEELDIGSCQITDVGLALVPNTLIYINLWGCDKITPAGVQELHRRLKYCSTNVAYAIMKELFINKFGS